MYLKNNVWILLKLIFERNCSGRFCSTVSTLLNTPVNSNKNLNLLKNHKYPESLYVIDKDVASKNKHLFFYYN